MPAAQRSGTSIDGLPETQRLQVRMLLGVRMGSTDHHRSTPSRREHDEDDERRSADLAACGILDPTLLSA
jgi:hypothetical protein